MLAVVKGDLAMVDFLMQWTSEVNAIDKRGMSKLFEYDCLIAHLHPFAYIDLFYPILKISAIA